MSLVPYHPREGREIVLYVIDLVFIDPVPSPSNALPQATSPNTPPLTFGIAAPNGRILQHHQLRD